MALGSALPDRQPESSGTVYYVDKDSGAASNGNTGTDEAHPWATIGKAFQSAPANALVRVKKAAQPYHESLSISRGGAASHPITIQAYDPADKPVMLGAQNMSGAGAAYWRLRNLVFDADGTHSVAFKATFTGSNRRATGVGAHDIEFDGCEALNSSGSGAGWLLSGDDVHAVQWWNCLAHNNDTGDTTAHGWYLDGGHDLHHMNCIARDNGGYGFHMFHGDEQTVHHANFYNCLSVSQEGRAGWIVQYDGPTDNVNLVEHHILWRNCISAYNATSGWRFKADPITNWAGYTPNTMDWCLSYGNPDVDVDAVDPEMIVNTNMSTDDPMFTDPGSNDFTLQPGSSAIGYGDEAYCPPIDYTGAVRSQCDAGPYAFAAVPGATSARLHGLGSLSAASTATRPIVVSPSGRHGHLSLPQRGNLEEPTVGQLAHTRRGE